MKNQIRRVENVLHQALPNEKINVTFNEIDTTQYYKIELPLIVNKLLDLKEEHIVLTLIKFKVKETGKWTLVDNGNICRILSQSYTIPEPMVQSIICEWLETNKGAEGFEFKIKKIKYVGFLVKKLYVCMSLIKYFYERGDLI